MSKSILTMKSILAPSKAEPNIHLVMVFLVVFSLMFWNKHDGNYNWTCYKNHL